MYEAANDILGDIVKVTPSSKVVGDLALALVSADADPADFEQNPRDYDIPDSVIAFLSGQLGDPPGGWPEPFRTKALEGRKATGVEVEDISEEDALQLAETGQTRRTTLNRLLFPGPAAEYQEHVRSYGDTSVLHTRDFLYGMVEGHEHVISLGKGMRTVMVTLNGQQRQVEVRDRSVESNVHEAEKADTSKPGHVPAPFSGTVTVSIDEGTTVEAGDTVATIEAMKMEAGITAPVA